MVARGGTSPDTGNAAAMTTIEAAGGAVPDAFLRLPYELYRGTPAWSPRPPDATVYLLDPARNPYWKQAERELFMAVENGDVAGRIVAVYDPEYCRQHHSNTGFFGFFECRNDAALARALVAAAARWLAARGCRRMTGPFHPMPDAYDLGLLVEGFALPQNSGEPYNFPFYQELFAACGLRKLVDLSAFHHAFANNPVWEKMMARLHKHLQLQTAVRVRPFDPAHGARDTEILRAILNDVYAGEPLFSCVPSTFLQFVLQTYARPEDMRFFLIVEVQGEPAGMNLLAPDYDEALRAAAATPATPPAHTTTRTIHGIRTGEFCIAPRFRHTAAAAALFHASWEMAVREGFQWAELSFQQEDNTAICRMLEAFGAVRAKRFRIYEGDVPTGL